jgi:tetratricopeptide (TPR) repeat protein/tRNA A-37 threonylcarbamoyl transferase component Bud32
LIGQTVSHYKILEKLGEGGMGVVYKARDLKLDRFVALKFLSRDVDAEGDAKRRFVLEAKSASSLDHPNICIIHEIDETSDGRTFIVMPCYEGETLNEKLRKGSLEIAEAIDIVRQVASGLANAHEKGIVHRDIKPGNILLTHDGQVKIMDFGLAKLVGQTRITRSRTTVGTACYMSPQQAMGAEVDARSDVFSLGVVLFELLTGHLPFKGDHETAVLYGIINVDAPPLSTYRNDIPGELEEIIEKALEKDIDERHENAAELKDELDAFSAALTVGKPMQPRRTTRRKRTGQRAGRKKILAISIVGVILGAVALNLLWQQRVLSPSAALALAVMDFRDLATPEDPTVSAGMTGLVHVGLVESCPVRVISPEYLYDLRRRLFNTARGPIEEAQALEVARRSGATMLLSGQMGRLGAVSYVTWRLVDVSSGESLAARRVEGANQALVADQIIAEVLPPLAQKCGVEAPVAPRSVTTLTTTSPEAYRHYVAGSLAREEARYSDALHELEEAVKLDTTFAMALFELSRTPNLDLERELARDYADQAWEQRTRLGIKDRMRLEAWREWASNHDADAINTYREMLARWPDDRKVLEDLSEILYYNWYFDEVASVAEQGLTLYPDDLTFANVYGNSLAFIGRSQEALETARTYVERYPNNPNAWDDLGLRYLEVGLPDSAEVAFRRALEIDADFLWSRQGIGYSDYCRGNVDGAIETFEEILKSKGLSSSDRVSIVTDVSFWPGLGLLYAETGRFERALGLFDEAWRDFSSPETARELEGRIQLSMRMGHAAEALRLAQILSERGADYERLSAKHYEARALVALDSLDAARSVAANFRTMETTCGRSEPFLLLRVTADIALAEGDPESAIAALEEMHRHGVPRGGLKDIERRESLAQAYRMKGRLKDAARVLMELLGIYGGHALAHYELGQIYKEMGRPAEAEKEYVTFLDSWSRADEGLPQLAGVQTQLEALRTSSHKN